MALKNAQHDAIMRTYYDRQARHRYALEQRIDDIYARIPELKELDVSISSFAANQARKAIEGDVAALSHLKQKLQELREEKQALLAIHGFSMADLELSYDCPDCKDTGYIGNEKCHCFRQAEISLLYDQSHLRTILNSENFQTFSYACYEPDDLSVIKRIVMEAQVFVDSFDTAFRNLFLLGEVGTGKTFLSNCIAKELMDTCHSVVYLTAFEIFDLLQKATFEHGEDSQQYKQSYPYLFDCDLLIIDDLGTELTNSFISSQLFLCVNERILKQKSTIISSNLSWETLRDTYSERTLSRITSYYTVMQMPGKDIRIKKKLRGNT